MMKRLLVLVVMLGLVSISGCGERSSGEPGVLEGRITIGPLCPVERFPQDPRCQPTEETYRAWKIAVSSSKGKEGVAVLEPDLQGWYQEELPAGMYVVDYTEQHHFAGKELPVTVEIRAGEKTTLNIDIDTGIR